MVIQTTFILIHNFETLFCTTNLWVLPHEDVFLVIKEDVPQDVLWNAISRQEQLAKISEIIYAHERIGELIQDFRRQEGMRLPGGFQMERLVEMLEERYGGEQLLEIEKDLRQHGIFSNFYKESKTYFDYLRRNSVTESFLRKKWQGK